MSKRTKVLVVGFGNVAQGVLKMTSFFPDIEIVGIVTRRVASVGKEIYGGPIFDLLKPETYLNCGADVAIMCGGSKEDLPKQTPFFARYFNVVDSFDTHRHIGPYIEEKTGQPMLGHLETLDIICRESQHTGHIGIGWDPGTFSLMRALFSASMPGSRVYAFYGLTPKGGLSMGHTNAIKGIPGVIDARQYTHAKLEAIERIRNGENPVLADRDMHWRECKVVAPESEQERIREVIVGMPNYFVPYDTEVVFVHQAELDREKPDLSHDGLVVAYHPLMGYMEFKNVWQSNPVSTASFLLLYARATHRINEAGKYGCLTMLNTPVAGLLADISEAVGLI